jgi:aspartyl-tRNA(Asn)/glutamyl-tRNA(Gln) amidotransferase subunit C
VDVKHITKLARIGLTEAEEKKIEKELSAILEYVDELNRVNTEGVLPMAGGTKSVNVMRPDEPRRIDLIDGWALIDQAPESKDGFIKVPRILE